VTEGELAGVYQQPPDGHYIFQPPVPGPLEQDRRAAAGTKGPSPLNFSFRVSRMAPTLKTKSGEARIIDSRNFPVANTIAAAYVVVKPGGLRELHWHPNADEWQYYLQGQGRMTVFFNLKTAVSPTAVFRFNGAKARTADFTSGDVGLVPKTLGHYLENTGSEDLIFLEMFKADRFQDISLSEWVRNAPPELMMAHLGIGSDVLSKIPKDKLAIVPA
jgi:oxalate decarboxylase